MTDASLLRRCVCVCVDGQGKRPIPWFVFYPHSLLTVHSTSTQLDTVLMTLTAMGLPTDGSSSKYEAMAAESEDPNRRVRRTTFDILPVPSLSSSSGRRHKRFGA